MSGKQSGTSPVFVTERVCHANCKVCGHEFTSGAFEFCEVCNDYRYANVVFVEHQRLIAPNRVRIFNSTDGKCFYCGRELDIGRFHVEHKTPIARGGNDRPDNLTASCADCNTRKGSQNAEEFLELRDPQ